MERRFSLYDRAGLAAQKGLEMAIAGSPGWSVTGGPWVKSEDAMKKLVWSETLVKGGQEFREMLPHPPDLKPVMTKSGGEFEIGGMLDHDLSKSFFIPPMKVGEDMWIQYAFEKPQIFKAMGISGASQNPLAEFNGAPENREMKVSDDGLNFRTIASFWQSQYLLSLGSA